MVRPSIPIVAILATTAWLDVVPGCRAERPDDWEQRQAEQPSAATDPTLAGPIAVSRAVPADAGGVAIVRAPESLFDMANLFGAFGPPDPGASQELHEEVDAFLRDRIGVALTSATSVTLFYSAAPERFGVIVEGVEGEPRGTEHSRHGETILRTLDRDVLIAKRGSLLLLGNQAGLVTMLDTLDGKTPALADQPGQLGALLAEQSDAASFAVVTEFAQLPAEIAEPAVKMGVERAYFGIGRNGLRLVANGTPEGMAAAAQGITLALEQAQAEMEKEKQAAMQGDDTLEGVAMIVAAHTGKRFANLMHPVVDGGRLSVIVPLGLGDSTMIVALAGVVATVSVPALQKYMRRAKTSEAKTQLAKLYDATVSYFKEEHVSRDAIAKLALHQCPNNGQAQGEAGITPPLSVNCNEGPGGRCVPTEGGGGAGYYDTAMWRDNPVWSALDYSPDQGHYFHYNFIWRNFGEDGYGACQFTIQAFADLDDDGVFSTYERSGAGDVEGVNAAVGLYIDNEVE